MEQKPHIIEVSLRSESGWINQNRPYNLVGLKTDLDELWASIGNRSRAQASGINNPKVFPTWIDHNALGRHDPLFLSGDTSLLVHCDARKCNWLAIHNFSHSEWNVITPTRVIDENAP